MVSTGMQANVDLREADAVMSRQEDEKKKKRIKSPHSTCLPLPLSS